LIAFLDGALTALCGRGPVCASVVLVGAGDSGHRESKDKGGGGKHCVLFCVYVSKRVCFGTSVESGLQILSLADEGKREETD
jgi:hypothetical protein